MSKKELEAELRMKTLEIEYLKSMLASMQEQRDTLTDVLVSMFGSNANPNQREAVK